jgi:hypothetical protein
MKNYFLVLISNLLCLIYSDAVCDKATLLAELRQDLADNNILDCLRIINPPHNHEEDMTQSNLRLAAQWESDCAFEADYDWQAAIKEQLGIGSLVSDDGDPVENDFPDQADMCEIIRAAYASNKFPEMGNILTKINPDFID